MDLTARNRFCPTLERLETRTTPAFLGGLNSFAQVRLPTWPPAIVAPVTPVAPVLSLNQKVLDFAKAAARSNATVRPDMGGDCYDFAYEAVRKAGGKVDTHTGAKKINGEVHYVWGKTVYQKSKMSGWSNVGSLQDIRAGDIIQIDACKFGSKPKTNHHTAIVESVDARTGKIQVIHQNINGIKQVFRGEYNMNDMTAGVFTVYRPQAR